MENRLNQDAQNAAAILQAGQLLADVRENPHEGARAFVIVPEGSKVEYLERADNPPRSKGSTTLLDVETFCRFYKDTLSDDVQRVYARPEPAMFVGVFNDATWRDHTCTYAPKLSKEWNEWKGKNKTPFQNNESFALWLEDNLTDVVDPDNAEFMEMALNFRVNSTASFSKSARLSDGNTQFTYNNTVEGSAQGSAGTIKIPEQFTIEVPVYEGRESKKYRVDARFRYRLAGGELKLWYELVRPHKVLEQAFLDLVAQIETAIDDKLYFGQP